MRHRQFGLVAGMVAIIVAGCSPPTPTAAKPSPTASTSPAGPASEPAPARTEASPTPSVMPSPNVYPRLPILAGTPRCTTSQLEVAFVAGDAAAGNVEETFEMRNTTSTGCWVYGYVGFQTLGADGRPLPQTVGWSTNAFFGQSEPPTRILLPASTSPLDVEPRTGHAFFNLSTNDVMCDANMKPVASLRIWPPDEYRPLTIPAKSLNGLQFVFCGGFELNPLQIQPTPRLE